MKLSVMSLSLAVAIAAACPTMAGAVPGQTIPATAVPTERLELARRFVQTTEPGSDMMDGLRGGFWEGATRNIAAEDRAAVEEHLERLFALLEPHAREAMPAFLDAYAQVYAREFSTDELRQLVAFAETPVGKRYLSLDVALDSDPLIIAAQTEFAARLTSKIQELAREACVKQADKRIAAGDTAAKCPISIEGARG